MREEQLLKQQHWEILSVARRRAYVDHITAELGVSERAAELNRAQIDATREFDPDGTGEVDEMLATALGLELPA